MTPEQHLDVQCGIDCAVGVEPSCSVIDQGDSETPPRVRIGVTADVACELAFGPTQPFSAVEGRNDGQRLLLIPDDDQDSLVADDRDVQEFVPATPISGCWTARSGVFLVKDVMISVTLTRGETITEEYTLLNHPGNSGCFPSGKYVFEDTIWYNDRQRAWRLEVTVD